MLLALMALLTSSKVTEAAQTKISFELIDNRIFVDLRIHYGRKWKFIFDTGGMNAMTPDVAKAAGLTLRDPFEIGGAGGKKFRLGKQMFKKCASVRFSSSIRNL